MVRSNKDYAKRSYSSHNGQNHKESHLGLWLFTVVLFIAFTLGLVTLGKYRHHHSRNINIVSSKNKNITNTNVDVISASENTRIINTDANATAKTRAEATIESIATNADLHNRGKNEENKYIQQSTNNAANGKKNSAQNQLLNQQQEQQLNEQLNKQFNRKKSKEQQPQQPQQRQKQELKFEFTTPAALEAAAAQKIVDENKMHKSAVPTPNPSPTATTITAVSTQQNTSINTAAITATSAAPKESVLTSAAPEQYLLDIVKSKNYIAAEKVRAHLALIGYEANVVTIAEQKNTYYSINLGPYTKNDAIAHQKLLTRNKIKAILHKI